MSVEQAKVSMSAGVTVEYAVLAGTVMIEAKSASGDLGVLELTTGQARELQLALLHVLGEPLGVRSTGGLEMLASIDGQPSFSVLPATVRELVRCAVALQASWVGNDVPFLQRLYDGLLEAVDAVVQDRESECWLLSSAWLKARGEIR